MALSSHFVGPGQTHGQGALGRTAGFGTQNMFGPWHSTTELLGGLNWQRILTTQPANAPTRHFHGPLGATQEL